MSIAKTILEQLGGNQFIVLTGAKQFLGLENGLRFRLPRHPGLKINAVTVTLDPTDTYTVCFYAGEKLVADYHEVYCDMLRGIFEEETKLRTSLTAVYA